MREPLGCPPHRFRGSRLQAHLPPRISAGTASQDSSQLMAIHRGGPRFRRGPVASRPRAPSLLGCKEAFPLCRAGPRCRSPPPARRLLPGPPRCAGPAPGQPRSPGWVREARERGVRSPWRTEPGRLRARAGTLTRRCSGRAPEFRVTSRGRACRLLKEMARPLVPCERPPLNANSFGGPVGV